MKENQTIPEIAEIVRHWMPDANEDELREATINLREYLAVIYRIFLRLEAENRLDEICVISDMDGRVNKSNNK